MRRNVKNGFVILLILALAAACTGCSFSVNFSGDVDSGKPWHESIGDHGWRELSGDSLDYKLMQAEEWTGLAEDAYLSEERGWLIHNGGQMLKCEDLNVSEEYFLVGVYCFKYWDEVPVESYYFSDRVFDDLESLENWIRTEQNRRYLSLMGIGLDFQARDFTWWSWTEDGELLTSLCTRLLAFPEETNVNGKPGTLWDVQVYSDFEAKEAHRLRGCHTKVDVKEENQGLVSVDPAYDTGERKDTISISASGGIKRTITYEEIPLEADYSKSEDCAKWTYDMPKMTGKKLSMEPSLRVSSTGDGLTVKLNHEGTFQKNVLKKQEFSTGEMVIAFQSQ